MSRFSGKQDPDAARILRDQRRAEAEARQEAERARDEARAAGDAERDAIAALTDDELDALLLAALRVNPGYLLDNLRRLGVYRTEGD